MSRHCPRLCHLHVPSLTPSLSLPCPVTVPVSVTSMSHHCPHLHHLHVPSLSLSLSPPCPITVPISITSMSHHCPCLRHLHVPSLSLSLSPPCPVTSIVSITFTSHHCHHPCHLHVPSLSRSLSPSPPRPVTSPSPSPSPSLSLPSLPSRWLSRPHLHCLSAAVPSLPPAPPPATVWEAEPFPALVHGPRWQLAVPWAGLWSMAAPHPGKPAQMWVPGASPKSGCSELGRGWGAREGPRDRETPSGLCSGTFPWRSPPPGALPRPSHLDSPAHPCTPVLTHCPERREQWGHRSPAPRPDRTPVPAAEGGPGKQQVRASEAGGSTHMLGDASGPESTQALERASGSWKGGSSPGRARPGGLAASSHHHGGRTPRKPRAAGLAAGRPRGRTVREGPSSSRDEHCPARFSRVLRPLASRCKQDSALPPGSSARVPRVD
ncbi:uncharacterized protein LOC129400070 [Sorex araneus]|uniref:uncharacterized protein LOC129400070 n=1 Tax=Sorex araneus TaxID=42254 RepID=UPI00243362A5|nr:uncharacterized protein LOC129400070 [Sorex araneus]